MKTKKILLRLSMIAIAFLLLNCNSKIFKDYSESSKDKGIYIPSGTVLPDTIAPDISTVTVTSHTSVRVAFSDHNNPIQTKTADFLGRSVVAALLANTLENLTNETLTDITVRGDDIVSHKYKVDAGGHAAR